MANKGQASISLSKSLFMRGLQCPKSLYLHKYHPELKDELSDAQQAIFRQGDEVGQYARQLFPGGVEIPYDGMTISEQLAMTSAEIAKGTATLYEAAFSYQDVFVKVDILHKGANGWELYEVKSSTDVEEVHINDAALQFVVLNGIGLNIVKTAIVHINNQYVRQGDIEPEKLFVVNDISAVVEGNKPPFITAHVALLQKMLLQPEMPDIGIGKRCGDPYPCDYRGYCWSHLPKNSVFDLRGKGVDKFNLYRQGIVEMKDISPDILNKSQRIQVEALVNRSEVIDKNAIAAFLETLFYPICFLDFETIFAAIPLFNGTRPYQQVPFQFSLHMIGNEESGLQHFEFLADPKVDPRRKLAERLLEMIPSNACIVTYTDFEAQRLSDLAIWFPEYAAKMDGLRNNIRDLALPFKNMDYYHWEMEGSYSIKKVLPQLVSDMSYKDLDIRDGGMAIDAYLKMNKSNDHSEISQLRQQLLQYCKLDTLAMVKILERLREIVT